ncbi:hypothetical protein BOX15_Mlig026481g1, partial [Macrostomum lignano]
DMAAFAGRFRQSKFKHVFGKGAKREFCYDNIRVTKSSWDSTFCAVNPKYIAIITDAAGGGAFMVLAHDQYGRVERDPPLVAGHKAAVLDVQWCPHDDEFIASASEDCTAKVWRILPESFSDGNLTESYRDLVAHNRRVGLVVWHPSAYMVLLTAGADNKVLIWNVEEEEVMKEIEFPDNVLSCSFNWVGSMFVCSCKDKVTRVVNARTGEYVAEEKLHEGTKPQQVLFLRDGRVFSTGFSRMSERQWGLWNGSTLEPIDKQELDNSNGVLFPFYDPDVNLLYLVGKGDSVIRYFEVTDDAPYVHFLNVFQSSEPQRGMGWMPKRGLDVSSCEISRLYKLHQKGLCEPISFTVPRKSELFQDDLYPDTCAESYALTAEEWLQGKDAEPVLSPVRPDAASAADIAAAKAKKRVPEKRPKKSAASAAADKGDRADVPANHLLANSNSSDSTAAATIAADPADTSALESRVADLEATVQNLTSLVESMRDSMAQLTSECEQLRATRVG